MRNPIHQPPLLTPCDDTGTENLKQIIDASLDIICTINREGRFTWVNQAIEKILGYSCEEITQKTFKDLVVETDLQRTIAIAYDVFEGKEFRDFENEYYRKDGSVVHLQWSATFNAASNIMYCVARDVTEIKKSRFLLDENNHILRDVLKLARMGSWQVELADEKVTISDELFELYGLDKNVSEQEQVQYVFSILHPDERDLMISFSKNILNAPETFVHRMMRPDGKMLYIQQHLHFIKNKEGWIEKVVGLARDITKQKEYEEQLLLKEKRFGALIQSGSDIIGVLDKDGNYLYASDNTEAILGYKSSCFIGKNPFEFIHPEDVPAVVKQLATIYEKDFVEIGYFRFRNAAGEWRWIESKVSNQINNPAIGGLVVNSRDITEKKNIQDKIAQLSKIAEQTSNAVVITNKNGRISWVNAAFEKITGYRHHDVIGQKPGALLQGPESDIETMELMSRQIKALEPFDVEIINYTKDRKPYWMHIQCQPQFDEQGKVFSFFAIQTDITERKKLELQLQNEIAQRQKKVTSAIVKAQERERTELSKELHDNVNQILTTVKLYLDIAEDNAINNLELVQKARHFVGVSIEEIRQISKKLAAPEQLNLKLDEAIRELVDSLSVGGKIKFDLAACDVNNVLIGEDVRLAVYRITQEHLTNIIKHANASNVDICLLTTGTELHLTIIDNGVGFDVTKKRKGIGLSNMYNRIETVNGKLEMISKPGEGCSLLAMLPLQ